MNFSEVLAMLIYKSVVVGLLPLGRLDANETGLVWDHFKPN